MWNGIHIPPEWFRESHGRNGPRMRGTESTMPKSSIGICRRSIWASSTHQFLLPQPPPPSSTMPTHRHILAIVTSSPPSRRHHLHRWPPPTTSIAQDQHSKDDVAMPRHQPDASTTAWGIQGAMSLAATWQAHDEWRQCHCSLLLFLFLHNVSCSSPFVPTDIANNAYTTLPLLYHTTTTLHHTPAPQSPPPPHLGHPITTTITPDNAMSH